MVFDIFMVFRDKKEEKKCWLLVSPEPFLSLNILYFNS